MMPVQDGYETCKKLRDQGFTASIILVSALQEQTQKEKAHACGATAYIQKPLTRDVLKIHLDYIQTQSAV
jgi:CheY-like chemotaxis protein